MKRYLFILVLLSTVLSFSCGKVAATLDPTQKNLGYVGTPSGTSLIQVQAIYPTETAVDVPVDTNIVIVFTKDVDPGTLTFITLTLGGADVNCSRSVSGKIVTLNPAADLAYSTSYVINVNSGILATDGQGLDTTVPSRNTVTFPTCVDGSNDTKPRVLAATRTPMGDGVSTGAGYIEVTFSRAINTGTVPANFSVAGGGIVGLGAPVVMDAPNNTTFRRSYTSLAANTTYTVTLTTGIQSSTGASLDNSVPGELVWTFKTTKAGDTFATGDYAISSFWISDITSTSVRVNWETNGSAVTDFEWGGSTSYGTLVSDESEIHNIAIPPSGSLTPATKYYFRIRSYDAVPAQVSEITGYFFTSEGTTNDTALSTGVTSSTTRQEMSTLMDRNSDGTLNGNTYVLWLQDSSVRASYLTGSSETWQAVVDTNVRTSPRMFPGGRGYNIVTMQSGINIYAKLIYNGGASIGFQGGAWGSLASSTGIPVSVSGLNPSAAIVWGGQGDTTVDGGIGAPLLISSAGTDNAIVLSGTNWFYDFGTDFAAASVAVGNTIMQGLSSTSVQSDPATTYRFAILQNSNIVSAGDSYSIWDGFTPLVSGTADTYSTTMLLDDTVDFTVWGVAAGDNVFNLTTGSDAAVASAAYTGMINLNLNIFANGNQYRIYRFTPSISDTAILAARTNTSVVAGQLNDSVVDFVAANVSKGDLVYNITYDTYAVVVAAPAQHTLVLNDDIFASGGEYIIFQVNDSSSVRECLTESGVKTSAGISNILEDSNAVFDHTAHPVYPGDVVHIQGDSDLLVTDTSNAASHQLTLSGNIASGDAYSILQPKAFFVYQRTDNAIRAKLYRLRDGVQYGAAINLDTATTCGYPMTVSDGSGGAYVFYERESDIIGVHINGVGTVTASTVIAAGTFYLVDVKCDIAGNAYVLYEDAGTVYITKRTTTLADGWGIIRSETGHDSVMTLDSAGAPMVAYSNSGWIYISKFASASPGTPVYSNVTVQHVGTIAGTYLENSDVRKSNISITSGQSTGAIVSWVDGRYYDPHGYTILAQLINAGGTRVWNDDSSGSDYDGRLIGFTGEFRATASFNPAASCYNDGGNWNPLFFWFDYRNGITEIYYDANINY